MGNATLLSGIFDYRNPATLASRLRQKRYEGFHALAASVDRPMRILDVGGRPTTWERIGFVGQSDIDITLLNLEETPAHHSNMKSVIGDACSMPHFKDKEFDIVFSNSVVEHVGGAQERRAMANEIRRVAKRYYVQTPNRYFLVEPHFVFPLFQFLPVSVRTTLVQNFALGWYPKIPDRAVARAEVTGITLLSKRDLQDLFPEATCLDEKFLGLCKSLQAVHF
jgi:hypothetical protein